LIYGIPGQTLDSWQYDLATLLATGVPHLSLYCLEVYEATPLGQAIARGEVQPPDEELAADMYDWARSYLPEQELQQYEISNFARAGWECKHNINYWRNGEYIGLGPAACSYWQGRRECNVSDLNRYRQLVKQGQQPIGSSEILDEQAAAAETIILGLRLNAGIDKAAFAARFGYELEDAFADEIYKLLNKGWLVRTERGYALASHMQPIANVVFLEFLRDSNT
jgi:oxygen-independent coproporphyrinogen-3 oxidase